MIEKNHIQNKYLWQIVILIIVAIQKIVSFLMVYLFLFDIKTGLYPYLDIQDSFSSYVISSNAVFFKICCSLVGILLAFFSIILCLYSLKKNT